MPNDVQCDTGPRKARELAATAKNTKPKERKPESPNKRAFSPSETASHLSVSLPYVWNLIKDGKLPSRKLGKRRLILARDLDAFIESLPAA